MQTNLIQLLAQVRGRIGVALARGGTQSTKCQLRVSTVGIAIDKRETTPHRQLAAVDPQGCLTVPDTVS